LFRRTRYQTGSLQRVKRRKGPDAWIFRWYEIQTDGATKYRKSVVGNVEHYPTESAAQKAADALRITINQDTPRAALQRISFETLVSHYLETELPEDQTGTKVPKAYSTVVTYKRYLKKWILPRWKSYSLREIEPMSVEDWLFGLKKANGTKAKVRNIMSALFRHAIRHGFLPRDEHANPLKYVRQSASSDVVHTVLTVDQVLAILSHLREPCYTMAFLDASTGLRVSELLALKWTDIDFEAQQIRVSRAIVYGVVGKCKSKVSKKAVPLDPVLAEILWDWRLKTPYNQAEDWVFASPRLKGQKPYTPGMLIKWHLRPAGKKAKVQGRIGWHTFRRTVATLLVEHGNDIKVVQELLRHANSKVTLDLYAQAVTQAKRDAQSKIVKLLRSTTPELHIPVPGSAGLRS
jgi:integrase